MPYRPAPKFQFPRQLHFLRLAGHGLAAVEHEVLDQLLGDGRGAGHGFSRPHVGPCRAGDGRIIGAIMLVEALVLGGDEGLRHVGGQAADIGRPAIAGAADVQRVAVAVNELDGRLALGLPQFRHRGQAGHAEIERAPFPEGPSGASQQDNQNDQHEIPPGARAEKSEAGARHLYGPGAARLASLCRRFAW